MKTTPVTDDTISDTHFPEPKNAPKRKRHAKAAPAVTPPAQEPAAPAPGLLTEAAIEKRLTTLKSEFEAGNKMLADLQTKRAELESTMLRISGAIQVLEELLSKKPAEPADPPA